MKLVILLLLTSALLGTLAFVDIPELKQSITKYIEG